MKVKIKHTISLIKPAFNSLWLNTSEILIFFFMLNIFILYYVIFFLLRLRFLGSAYRNILYRLIDRVDGFVAKTIDKSYGKGINRMELFELAFRSMSFKKSRTIITVGGMALGIGAIVFLVSLGFGLQQLVIERVARLDELKQADVSVQPGSNIKLSREAVESFKELGEIEEALPLIGVVAKVNYSGSVTDVAVYGVTTKYLETSAIRPIAGNLFHSDDIAVPLDVIESMESTQSTGSADAGTVSGVSVFRGLVKKGEFVRDVKFIIFPQIWLPVSKEPGDNAEILGYTRRAEGVQFGEEIWGDEYSIGSSGKVAQDLAGDWVGKWVKSDFYIWEKKPCLVDEPDCDAGEYEVSRDSEGNRELITGYIQESDVMVDSTEIDDTFLPQVLGISDDSTESSLSADDLVTDKVDDEDLQWLDVVLETTSSATLNKIKKLSLSPSAKKEAVVNLAFLKVLGIDSNDAVGKTFDISYIVTSNLLDGDVEKIESEDATYKVDAIIPGDSTPVVYVPIEDLRYLGVANNSQIKVIAKDKDLVGAAREKIEAMGYVTNSVVDTVAQINNLFSTLRLALGLLGSVALGVASLGMFNTLTVSLLERTREIGLMKALGMSSLEVKRLFLTESMLMGFMGGLFGIFFGFLAGKLVSLFLSIVGVVKGVGFIDVAYLPISFVLLVFFLSLIVGIFTGFYPSKRATKISALNALRYE